MDLSLADTRYRTAVLIGSILIAVLLIFQASKLWLAEHWVASENLPLVERGAALIPDHGAAWDRMGHLRQYNLEHPDLAGAIEDYQHALRDDPLAAHYWMDLASAYEASGNSSGAAHAYTQAQAVYPDSAEVAFYYGNFLLRRQEYAKGFAELGRAVRGDSSLLPLAISRAWRATEDAPRILNQLLPPTAGAYLQAIDYFASIGQCDAALGVWSRLISGRAKVPLEKTFPLLNELIRENRSADAQRMWLEAHHKVGVLEPPGPSENLVWNGDFGKALAGGGLGWRWTPTPGVFLSFASAPPHTGGRALRLDFDGGSNLSLSQPDQYVAVEPASTYRFHALMRTDGITTESGLRFSISDPNHPHVANLRTENLTGTRPWLPIDGEFTTGPATHFLVLRLVRSPSRLFDSQLSGTVWIADVSLVSAKTAAEPQP